MTFFFTQGSQPNEIIQENIKQEERAHIWKKILSFRLGGPPPPSCLAILTMDKDSDTLQEPRQY